MHRGILLINCFVQDNAQSSEKYKDGAQDAQMIRSNAEKDALRQEREKDLERSNDGAFCRIVVFDRYVEQDLVE